MFCSISTDNMFATNLKYCLACKRIYYCLGGVAIIVISC